MKKQSEITARTRQNLIDAFWFLYCEKRIEKITVKEITQKAGYNRGTFYEYFIDVYDVLEQIEKSLIPSIDQLPPISMPNQTMGMPFEMFMKLYEQNNRYYSVLLGDKGDPSFQSKLKNAVKPMIKQSLGVNSTAEVYELDYILEFILSAMTGIMSYWFKSENAPPAEKLIELMYELMQNGVMTKLAGLGKDL